MQLNKDAFKGAFILYCSPVITRDGEATDNEDQFAIWMGGTMSRTETHSQVAFECDGKKERIRTM